MKTKRPRPQPIPEQAKGEGLADDLIGDDPLPADARRFDLDGQRLPSKKQ